MKIAMFVAAVVLGSLAAGCSFPSSGRLVTRQQAGQMQRIEYGTVEKVSRVIVEGQHGQIGTYGGVLTGVAATGGVGHGVGTDLARMGGAVVGAVAGQAVEEGLTRKEALELTIKLEDGSRVVITQVGAPVFGAGDRVAVAHGGGGARVLAP